MSDILPFIIERLDRQHNRRDFSCGVEALDRYIQTQASQDVRKQLAVCFIAREPTNSETIAGFYTLSACHILLHDLPEDTTKRLPRYPSLPAARVGRLAVDAKFKGHGLGSVLLANAASRAISADMGVFALTVDAKDDQARSFYQHLGFTDLHEQSKTLYMLLGEFSKHAR